MPIIRGTAVINRRSGVPEDASHNVWHFEVPGPVATADYEAVGTGLANFYDGCASVLSNTVSRTIGAHRIEVADVTPNGPGAANDVVSALKYTGAFTISQAGTGSMPSEVAIALSFQGDVVGLQEESGLTRPRSRVRGRVFLGPVAASTKVDENATTFEPVIGVAARESILDAYDNMLQTLFTLRPNLRHVVYSRVNGLGSIVVSARVDSEYDTQRSRGRRPSLRMTRTVTQGAAQPARDGADVVLAS
jgi:hypothetical protein